jgi:hypothetical protein
MSSNSSFTSITDLDAFMAATARAELAITCLACAALAGIVVLVLWVRRILHPKTPFQLLLNAGTTLAILASVAAVGIVHDAAFAPWHYVPIWCWPPGPLSRLAILLTAPITAWFSYALTKRTSIAGTR